MKLRILAKKTDWSPSRACSPEQTPAAYGYDLLAARHQPHGPNRRRHSPNRWPRKPSAGRQGKCLGNQNSCQCTTRDRQWRALAQGHMKPLPGCTPKPDTQVGAKGKPQDVVVGVIRLRPLVSGNRLAAVVKKPGAITEAEIDQVTTEARRSPRGAASRSTTPRPLPEARLSSPTSLSSSKPCVSV